MQAWEYEALITAIKLDTIRDNTINLVLPVYSAEDVRAIQLASVKHKKLRVILEFSEEKP